MVQTNIGLLFTFVARNFIVSIFEIITTFIYIKSGHFDVYYSSTAVITLFANEEISTSVNDAPSFVDIVMEDSISFLENTQTQISFVFNSSTNIGIDAVSKDLDGNIFNFLHSMFYPSIDSDMEDLLGRPFQRELALETGVDVALTALEELQNGTYNKDLRL